MLKVFCRQTDWANAICPQYIKEGTQKRRKCWLPVFSPFPTIVSKAPPLFSRFPKTQDCVMKGENNVALSNTERAWEKVKSETKSKLYFRTILHCLTSEFQRTQLSHIFSLTLEAFQSWLDLGFCSSVHP